jgi:hypothetical protein
MRRLTHLCNEAMGTSGVTSRGDQDMSNPDRWQVVGADEELPQEVIEALVALAIETLRQRGELPGAP